VVVGGRPHALAERGRQRYDADRGSHSGPSRPASALNHAHAEAQWLNLTARATLCIPATNGGGEREFLLRRKRCGHCIAFLSCPLYPRKQTLELSGVMSALCQTQTYAMQQFDAVRIAVGAGSSEWPNRRCSPRRTPRLFRQPGLAQALGPAGELFRPTKRERYSCKIT